MSFWENNTKLWVLVTEAILLLVGFYYVGGGPDSPRGFQPKPKAFSRIGSDNAQRTQNSNLEATTTTVQISTLDPEDEWMLLKAKEMEDRILKVKEVCEEEGGKANWKKAPTTMLVDDKHKLALCRHAKVGTSTLLSHFLSLIENLDNVKRQEILNGGPPRLHASVPRYFKSGQKGKMENMLQNLEDYTVFSFIRHPFERLLSAFMNKVVEKNYHKIDDVVHGNFSAFVDYVLHHESKHHCDFGRECKLINLHWRPFWARCGFCDIPYLIGHMETFQDDLYFIAASAGVADMMNITRSDSVVLNRSKQGGVNFAKTLEHFQLLDNEQKKRLYKMYEFDFRLFGYNPEPYILLEDIGLS